MKIAIDFSVNTVVGEAVGFVDGQIGCEIELLVGDTVCFSSAPNGLSIPAGHIYGGLLKVTGRTVRPNQKEDFLTLSLEDLTTETREHALAMIEYLEVSYGLFATVYERP
jgi:hypothetical protein